MTDTTNQGGVVSDPDASFDELVRKASTPNLATLFKRAKDQGLIDSVHNYGGKPQ